MSLGLVSDSYNNDSELSDNEDSKGSGAAKKTLTEKGEKSESVNTAADNTAKSSSVEDTKKQDKDSKEAKDRRERDKDRDERDKDRDERDKDRDERDKDRDDRRERDSDRRERDSDRRDKHKDRRDDKRRDSDKKEHWRDDRKHDRSRDYKHRRDSRDGRDNRYNDNRFNDNRHNDNRQGDNRQGDNRQGDNRQGDNANYRHVDNRDRRHGTGGGRDRRYNDRAPRDYSQKDKEYLEYRKRKYGDNLEWGKVSEESLKDVKTDSTLPSTFDSTIAKQLAAQREKRKLLWGGNKKEGEGSTQKSVWGSGSIKNDESGEQTAKFLKLMGVKDVTAENVKNFKTDESVLRSSQVVDSFEEEYEKSRYLQHMQRGVGLGLLQFTQFNKQPPPT